MASDLDAEIARRVFHYLVIYNSATKKHMLKDTAKNVYMDIPEWSSSTTVAHQLIQHFQKRGLSCRVNNEITPEGVIWTVGFCEPNAQDYEFVTSGSLPKAICIAALKLVK